MTGEYKYIPIEKDLIPYRFNIALGGKTFTLQINYNAEHDFFTIDLYRNDELILTGEKIVYGKILFDCQQYAYVPGVVLIPYNLALNEHRVTWDNLNRTVYLWLPSIDIETETVSAALLAHYDAGGNWYG